MTAVVESIRRVAPQTKFVGLALAQPSTHPEQFEYFLNPKNHKPGIPLDFISYHFYAVPTGDQNPAMQPYTFFAYADGFLNTVRYVETIRKRLSPETKTTIDEIGAISADDVMQDQPGHVTQPIPNSYWNLTCALYAYIFGELTRMGVDVAGESQLVGYPTQFPSVSMVDWNTGKPNSRIRVSEPAARKLWTGRQDRGNRTFQPVGGFVSLFSGGGEAGWQAADSAGQQAGPSIRYHGAWSHRRPGGLRGPDHGLRSSGLDQADRREDHTEWPRGGGGDTPLNRSAGVCRPRRAGRPPRQPARRRRYI